MTDLVERLAALMPRLLPQARDPQTGKVDVTTLVWLAASEMGHPEWSDDYDHPVFDVAVNAIEAAELQG